MVIIPVILSGGSGTRLWPLSRSCFPKQFLNLIGDTSLFQATLRRIEGATMQPPIVVSNNAHRFIVAEQLRELGKENAHILLEPEGKNTAPAIAAAALCAQQSTGTQTPLLLVLPADHNIENIDAFTSALNAGTKAAMDGKLVTFGIVPTHPETGYGYVRAEGSALYDGDTPVFAVQRFVEKPDAATAEQYLSSGEYYWNSGMFLFRADRYLEELGRFAPAILSSCTDAVENGEKDLDFFRLEEQAFGASPSDSIDYAVMEKTTDACVVPLDAGWSDVGAWSSLWEISPNDENGNTLHGDVIVRNSTDSYIHSESRLVSALGVKDLVIVETQDAVLVADKHSAQDVKKVVDELKKTQRNEGIEQREIYRPWGSYNTMDIGDRFQVKRIKVNPGAKLSLQKHHHRAEHWVVVRGTAEVTCDDNVKMLAENESTFIPLGSIHRLANPGKIPLEIIEIQSGSYLGEDDIERFDDTYGRGNGK